MIKYFNSSGALQTFVYGEDTRVYISINGVKGYCYSDQPNYRSIIFIKSVISNLLTFKINRHNEKTSSFFNPANHSF